MINTDPNIIIIYLGILAIILEILLGAATGFDLLLTGVIFVISGGIGIAAGSFPITLLSIATLSIIYFLFGRAFIKQKLYIQTKATSVEALIGKTGVVIKKITPQTPGQIKIEGEIWRAESDKEFDKEAHVVVQSVSGVTLKVT